MYGEIDYGMLKETPITQKTKDLKYLNIAGNAFRWSKDEGWQRIAPFNYISETEGQ